MKAKKIVAITATYSSATTIHPSRPDLGQCRRGFDDSMGDVADGHPDEHGDHDRPHHHAERAQNVDDIQGTGPQPHNKGKTEGYAGLQAQPVAA